MQHGEQGDVNMENTTNVNMFSLLYEGSFVSLKRSNQDILFEIDLQYLAELIRSEYTIFRGILKTCRECRFEPWGEEIIYEDITVIQQLLEEMEMLHTKSHGEEVVVDCYNPSFDPLRTEGQYKYIGGRFIFSCENVELFDQGGNSITVEQLEELSRKSVENVP